MVWVRPGKLPANVMVAPNSPSARAQHSTVPAASPGATIGRVTRRNTVHRVAPRVAAASSYRRSAAPSAPSTGTTRDGRAAHAPARATPAGGDAGGDPAPQPRRPRPPATGRAAPPPPPGRGAGG